MSRMPDHIDSAESEYAEAHFRLAEPESAAHTTALEAIDRLLGGTEHLTFTIKRSEPRLWVALTADRTGIVGPLLDEVCAALRGHPELDARVHVPGWVRTFHGWEKDVWSSDG